MSVSVLLVTPGLGFGELIRQTLEESGAYHVAVFNTGAEALEHAQKTSFALSILDADLVDVPIFDLWRALKSVHPDLKLIVIPPEEGFLEGQIAALSPDGYLDKPFYLPNLNGTVAHVLDPQARLSAVTETEMDASAVEPPSFAVEPSSDSVEPSSDSVEPSPVDEAPAEPAYAPPWLQDVDRAARHLAQLSLESAAQAALITRRDQVWAYAGELPQPAAHELARAVANYWADDESSDLARFLRLDATGGEYMLYATALAGELVLSLVFDAATPFSKIRTQAGDLARALASVPNGESAPPYNEEPEAEEPSLESFQEPVDAPLEPLLDDVPPPSPQGGGSGVGPYDESETMTENSLVSQLVDVFLDEGAPDADEMDEATPEGDEQPDAQGGTSPLGEKEREAEGDPGKGELDLNAMDTDPNAWEPEYPMGSQSARARPATQDPLDALTTDPFSPVLQQLKYTCLLIPRMPRHELTHDRIDRLTRWVPEICLAYGWRLERLILRQGYLLWAVEVSPDTAPLSIVDRVRRFTSERIFEAFSELKRTNPSGDFWAPGYLMISGAPILEDHLIRDFIERTRAWQGISDRT